MRSEGTLGTGATVTEPCTVAVPVTVTPAGGGGAGVGAGAGTGAALEATAAGGGGCEPKSDGFTARLRCRPQAVRAATATTRIRAARSRSMLRSSRDGPEPSSGTTFPYRMTQPRRAACTTASVRLATPSFDRMAFTWNFTV